ncbi:Phosphocarrier protein kinase/phosphorylase, nitrogen regulation associated [Hyphomicrobium sulfonivorans]|uniref:phosphoenolpyruvate--protein phosphotransferase n=1 Tax=Hyphomicrobium sulfonivorans TaxID=121290 RepID=A0A120CV16_HYPSL|nr:phosphoenolpyruvate--protein phosphotransferase [Hyphomicrobium sulfonivorans]KWT67125.1 Phosphocarrier protein kinase/phosphorylase, nitrogen regulation associated [Hyphomicrobium sulfonivorans]
MQRRGDEPRALTSEPALRVIMRRLREIMSQPGDGQERLNKIVKQIAGVMVAEVCSIYLKRQDGSLELFASEGLNPNAVHVVRMKRGEGLVGRCAELNITVNEPEASSHPSFSYRPETGEEIYHSLLAVPIARSGQVLGVLVVQNRTQKEYSDEDVEVLQATAMVVAEHLVSGAVAGAGTAIEIERSLSTVIQGERMAEGIALGHVVLHEPRIVVTHLMAEDPAAELLRLETAVASLRASLDEMFDHEHLSAAGEHRDVLEAYRMFAHDKGWERRLREAVDGGLTAEAAVERVQNSTRARMLRQNDAYWRERQRDLDDLSDRLLRILAGRITSADEPSALPPDTILVARTMGPAELLDYDRRRLRGLIVEDGSGQSHVAIVAKALGIAAVGQARGIVERVSAGDAAIVDAMSGQVHLRPSSDVIAAYSDKVRFLARRQRQYRALRDVPAVTRDGVKVNLNINAGLLVDMPHLKDAGADGVGLFRTELLFMLSNSLPKVERQADSYRAILARADGRPVVFRTLDIGGDKVLHYLRQPKEENPAMGWRAVRMGLDRPALLRTQVRALLRAAAGQELRIMIPMVSSASEMDAVHALISKEREILMQRGHELPEKLLVGAMIEVPCLLFELDELMPRVDFVSVGSNDMMQFLFAADRTNARVGSRFDPLTPAPLRALKMLAQTTQKHGVPLTLCGEMAGRPIEAMALIALGFRSLSMAPASIGPVKSMILSLDTTRVSKLVDELVVAGVQNIREHLDTFAKSEGVDV